METKQKNPIETRTTRFRVDLLIIQAKQLKKKNPNKKRKKKSSLEITREEENLKNHQHQHRQHRQHDYDYDYDYDYDQFCWVITAEDQEEPPRVVWNRTGDWM